MLKQHYRAPLPFDLEMVDEAKKIRGKLNNFVFFEMDSRPAGPTNPEISAAIDKVEAEFGAALRDDLNTSVAFASIHEFMSTVNRLQPSTEDAASVVSTMRTLDQVLGILDEEQAVTSLDTEIEGLITERNQARADKNWARADEIRDELLARGIQLVDTPQGTTWRTADE